MKRTCLHIAFTAFVCAGLLAFPPKLQAQSKTYDIEKALAGLDDAVAHYAEFEAKRNAEIEQKKQELKHASFDSDRYLVMTQIVDEYKKINSDSAISYANSCLELSKRCRRDDWYKETLISRASIYIYRGNLMLARQDLMSVGPIDGLSGSLRKKAASSFCSFYRVFNSNKMFRSSKLHAETLASMGVDWQRLPDMYLKDSPLAYYRAKFYVGQGSISDFDKVKALYESERNRQGVNNLGFILARMYKAKGDTMAYRYYLVTTVEKHIRNVYKCADATLELLSSDWLLDNPERAYKYVSLYSSDISQFRDNNRSTKVIAIQNKIVQRFIEEQEHMRRTLFVALVVSMSLCLLSVVLLVKLRHRIRKIKELNGRIDRRNKSLADNIKEIELISRELKVSNERLQAELKLRDGNFMDTYLMCSDYIKMHQNFRKTISNLLKTNSVKQAIKQLASKDATDAELKEFYCKFDKAFLSTHPDFIERFNLILRQEHRYTLNEKHELTPELRIYALISLGITNSVNIAEFLHYSTQTIYNYRLRMRHHACIPENMFAEAVANLYEDNSLNRFLAMGS